MNEDVSPIKHFKKAVIFVVLLFIEIFTTLNMISSQLTTTAKLFIFALLSFYPIKQNGQVGALSLGKVNNVLKGKYVVMSECTSQGEHDPSQFIKFRKFLPYSYLDFQGASPATYYNVRHNFYEYAYLLFVFPFADISNK